MLTVSALFKRKTREPEPDVEPEVEEVDDVEPEPQASGSTRDKAAPTPKQKVQKKKRPPKNPPMTSKEARQLARGPKNDKEARRERSRQRREERARIAEGHDNGDPLYDKYHMPRDKGPERLLVRDIVDARRNVGQYFFIVAVVIIIFSGQQMPAEVQNIAVLFWIGLLLAFVADSVVLSRKVKRLVWTRFPRTDQKKRGVYWYAISRSIMFRRLRMPRPRPHIGYRTPEDQLGKQLQS